jgi:hypothetical protein
MKKSTFSETMLYVANYQYCTLFSRLKASQAKQQRSMRVRTQQYLTLAKRNRVEANQPQIALFNRSMWKEDQLFCVWRVHR